MPTFYPFDSFTPCQLCTKVTNLVLCCITLSFSLIMIPCRSKHVGLFSVNMQYKYLWNKFVNFVGLASWMFWYVSDLMMASTEGQNRWELHNTHIYWNKAELAVINVHSVELLWHTKHNKIKQTWNMTSNFTSAVNDTFIFRGSMPRRIFGISVSITLSPPGTHQKWPNTQHQYRCSSS